MKATPKPYLIACGVLGRDLRRIVDGMGLPVSLHCLPGGLHETPDKLRSTLQTIIDEVSNSPQWFRIVLGYGTCGRGTVDLRAGAIPLIIPKVHDCIALFLGGDQAYRAQFDRFPGTYYISPGWFEEKAEPASQRPAEVHIGGREIDHDELVARVGENGARKTVDFFNSWKRNYQRAAFIDTGDGGSRRAAEHARRMAEQNDWRYETIAGDMRLLTKLLTAEQEDHDILVVGPGQVTYFDALTGGLSAKPLKPKDTGSGKNKTNKKWCVGDHRPSPAGMKLGLGIDAGGTYTDAVIFDFKNRRVLSKHKALTTRWNFAGGIRQALEGLNTPMPGAIELVTLSTTLATNALVEGDGQRVGLLLMPPDGIGPADGIDHQPKAQIAGRLTITGQVTEPVDQDQVRETAQDMIRRHQVDAFAVSGYAGHINPEHELQVKQILTNETGRFVCCGHELSNLLNFLVRARTAVLNARIIPRLGKLVADIRHLFRAMGIGAPIMVVKGDGSLMTAQMAVDRPVETILSGPAASAAGARFLTRQGDAVVMDIGGTTTDTALIANHKVSIRESGAFVGGCHTHVKALDIRTTGLGGDSHVVHYDGAIEVGPRRVTPMSWLVSAGYSPDKALAFLEHHRRPARGSTKDDTFMALSPEALPGALSQEEQAIVDLLRTGPVSILELIHRTGALHANALPLERLLSHNAIFRCALTPTDLLQAVGELDLWDRGTAVRAARLTARTAGVSLEELFNTVRDQMVRTMAGDILKMHLNRDDDPEAIDRGPVCRQLMAYTFDKHAGPQARYRLPIPIVGIGAPAGFFLPHVARLLKTELILPPDRDVANAIGAVTSRVEVQRQAIIKPDTRGGFYIEGLAGRQRFASIDEAQIAAVDHLLTTVRRLGAAAGTSRTAVHFELRNRTTTTAGHDEIFLERVISAALNGPPDGALKSQPMQYSSHDGWHCPNPRGHRAAKMIW